MERDDDSRRAVTAAARAAAAVFIDHPPTPRWYYPAWGVGAAAWVPLLASAQAESLVAFPLALVFFVTPLAFLYSWYHRYWGTWPASFRNAPAELRATFRGYLIGFGLILLAGAASYFLVGFWLAVPVVGVSVWLGLTAYEGRYESAAQAARERLAGAMPATARATETDPVVDRPERLAAVALLANSTRCDAGFLQRNLGLDETELAEELAALEDAGYVSTTVTRSGQAWYSLTKAGRKATEAPLAPVNALVRAA